MFSMTSTANPTYSELRPTKWSNTLAERFAYVDSVGFEGAAPTSVLRCVDMLLLFLLEQKPDLEKLDPDDPSIVFGAYFFTHCSGAPELFWIQSKEKPCKYQLTLSEALEYVECAERRREMPYNGFCSMVPGAAEILPPRLLGEQWIREVMIRDKAYKA